MARPAPGVERTVALVTFLSRHPGRSFGLSELARRLGLNKATAYSMLVALTEAGWLTRDPVDKTYRLGPALVAVGDAAAGLDRHVLELARPALLRLSDELGVQVVASAVVGDDMVIVAVEGQAAAPVAFGSRPGYTVPLAPPLGTVFMAWSEPAAVDRWLQRLGPRLDERRRARYRHALDVVRRRSYAVALQGEGGPALRRALAALAADAANPEVRAAAERVVQAMTDDDYLLVDLDGIESYQLGLVSAPVFDRTGRVCLAVTLTGFAARLTAEEMTPYARRLTATTASLTARIGGSPPSPSGSPAEAPDAP
ncbi:MAG TPA: helix-turn-helix domain-containing protein [Acidimicrobiales bacterium]